jgi:hypothetical protein
MAFNNAIYLVSRDIAIRSGLIQIRYRIADGRFVLNNKDLSYVRFTPDEYINGLAGVERTSEEIAARLIAENGYKMGDDVTAQEEQRQEQESDNDNGDIVNTDDDLADKEENNETTER